MGGEIIMTFNGWYDVEKC